MIKKDPLMQAVEKHFREVHDQIIKEESEKASQRIRERMKKNQDQVIVSLLNDYTLERVGPDLQITVKHFYEKPKGYGE